MPPPGQPYNIHGTADGVLEALSLIFVRGKGFGIFSFMFGLSFVLQMQPAEKRRPGTDFRPRFAWRLLILFAIGWLHGLAPSQLGGLTPVIWILRPEPAVLTELYGAAES
jgi:hypothetical protein